MLSQQAREGSSWAFWGKSNEPGNTSHDGGDSSSSSTTEHTAGEFHAVHDALDRGKIGMGPSCSAPVLDGKNLPLGTALGHAAGEPGPVVASISRVIEAVHEGTGLPWWATLVLAGTGVRLALTPLGLQQVSRFAQLEDWLVRVPMLPIGSPHSPGMADLA